MPGRRAEDCLSIPIGTVVRHSGSGLNYVFLGWARNTVGHEAVLAVEMTGRRLGYNSVWTYFAAMEETLLRTFPGLEEFRTN